MAESVKSYNQQILYFPIHHTQPTYTYFDFIMDQYLNLFTSWFHIAVAVWALTWYVFTA